MARVALELAGDRLIFGQPLVFHGSRAGGVPCHGDGSRIHIDLAGLIICPPCHAGHDGILLGDLVATVATEGLEIPAGVHESDGAILKHVDPAHGHGQLLLLRIHPADDFIDGAITVGKAFHVFEFVSLAVVSIVGPGIGNGERITDTAVLGVGPGAVSTRRGVNRTIEIGKFIRAGGPIGFDILIYLIQQIGGFVHLNVLQLGDIGGIQLVKAVPAGVSGIAAEGSDSAGL